jgi:hypothetical protein
MMIGGHNMRTVMLIAVGLALTVGAAPSMAQKKNSALYPWERKGDQLVRDPQRDPMAKILEQDRKILKILGLPSNKMSTGGRRRLPRMLGSISTTFWTEIGMGAFHARNIWPAGIAPAAPARPAMRNAVVIRRSSPANSARPT